MNKSMRWAIISCVSLSALSGYVLAEAVKSTATKAPVGNVDGNDSTLSEVQQLEERIKALETRHHHHFGKGGQEGKEGKGEHHHRFHSELYTLRQDYNELLARTQKSFQLLHEKQEYTVHELESLRARAIFMDPEKPGTMRFASGATVGVYANLSMMGVYDFDIPGPLLPPGININELYFGPYIPTGHYGYASPAARQTGMFHFHNRMSNIGVKFSMPTSSDPIEGHFNFNLLGYVPDGARLLANRYEPALYVGYVKWGRWLAGQDFTTFCDMDTVPLTYSGSIINSGVTAIRQPLVRYTYHFTPRVTGDVALETPEIGYTDSNAVAYYAGSRDSGAFGTLTNAGYERYPDVIVRVKYKVDSSFGVSVAGVMRDLRVTDTPVVSISSTNGTITYNGVTTTSMHKAKATGFGATIAAHYFFPQTKNKVYAVYSGGRGIGRYVVDAYTQSAFFNLPAGTGGATSATNAAYAPYSLTPIMAHAGYMGYTHRWTPTISTNIAYGASHISNQDVLPNSAALKMVRNSQFSIIWDVVPEKFKLGCDLIYGEKYSRNYTAGGRITRIMVGGTYTFGNP